MSDYKDPQYEKVVARAVALGGVAVLTAIFASLLQIGRTILHFL